MNVFSELFKHLSISMIFALIGLIVGNLFISELFVSITNLTSNIFIIILLILALCSKKGVIARRFSMNYVYLFTFIEGILLYPTINYYLYDLGIGMFISIIITTIFIFLGLSMYAKNNNTSSVLNYDKSLAFVLFGIIIASIINIFLGSSILSIVISAISILLFSVYIIYDINLVKREISSFDIKDKNDLSLHVLNLYLDFINILLKLLKIASKTKK